MRLLPKGLGRKVRALIEEDGSPYRWAPDDFIPAMAVEEFVGQSQRILLVGDATRRDYELLTARGKDVTVLDIVPIPNVARFVQQSITERTPFADGSFDAVVMLEVLEHLFDDCRALGEIRRVLRDDGRLVLSVPYISRRQDAAPYHVRVYTPRTLERLLAHCGFRIEQHFCRGLVSSWPQHGLTARLFVIAPRLLLRLLFGRPGLAWNRRTCFRLERWLGSRRLLRWLQRRRASYGGILGAAKAEPVDFAQAQLEAFGGKATDGIKP